MSESSLLNRPESRQVALLRVITQIHQCQDLHRIFKTTTTEVRQLMDADRVAVFRFSPHQEWEGEFIAESVGPQWKSALANPIYDHCFSVDFAPLYTAGQTSAIADIYAAELQDCHVKILEQFEVRANLVVPLLTGKVLWGLLCVHQCGGPREWHADEIEFARVLGEQLGGAIQRVQYLQTVKERADRQTILVKVISQIRQSQDLMRAFKVSTQEMRHLMDADRVGVFWFDPEKDWAGEFIAESVGAPWESVLAHPVYDHCFSPDFLPLYKQGRHQAIADIYAADLQDCHIKILEQFQVKANLVVPIRTANEHLWGLLCVHQCEKARHWPEEDIEFVVSIAEQLGVAIQQADYLEMVKGRADRQRILVQIISRIRQAQDLNRIFKNVSQELRLFLESDRVGIFKFKPDKDWEGEFIAESVGARWKSALNNRVKDHCFSERFAPLYKAGQVCTITDIENADLQGCHYTILKQFEVRSNLVLPITIEDDLWGLLCVHQCDHPRKWKDEEIEFSKLVVEHLGIAIQQSQYWEQVRAKSAEVAKVEALKKLAERQNLVGRVVEKIRQSLDLETIFVTTTREARYLLALDRVAIYQFLPDWSGQFIAESFADGWDPLVGTQGTFTDSHLQDTQGGRYRHHESLCVDDIYNVGYEDCHIQLLEQFQAHAYAIVPIFRGEGLWGLLAGYQNDGPRQWQQQDVDLLEQIGAQLGIAIQQAELLIATQDKNHEVTQTLNQLRSTQLQLIQGEKMSSLGQLVAGIAHEINNPVTFIYANISHVKYYLLDLLSVIQQCQEQRGELPQKIGELIDECDMDFVTQDLPKTLESIAHGSDRIRELVSSLRTFSRLDEAEVKEVDVAAGIESTLVILQSRLKARSDRPAIEVVKRLGNIPPIECYAAQLNQVFMNIIANAIDALEEHNVPEPCIEIELLTQDNNLLVAITNNGPAIPEEVREKLFDPFFTTKQPGKGTGLGLSISYQIVTDRHGGQLQCESRDGKTTFQIQVPIHRSSRGSQASVSSSSPETFPEPVAVG